MHPLQQRASSIAQTRLLAAQFKIKIGVGVDTAIAIPASVTRAKIKRSGSGCGHTGWPPSDSIPCRTNEQDKDDNHSHGHQHPVLAFDAQNDEVLHEKLHRLLPPLSFVQSKRFVWAT
jgi:hypothetical protein